MKAVTDAKRSSEQIPGELSQVRERAVSGLRELGLSSYAAKAFVTILERQPVSAGGICEINGTPDSKIYYALKELEDRELVMAQHGTPSVYMISNAPRLLHGLEQGIQAEHRRRMETLHELERSMETLADRRKMNALSSVEIAYVVKGFRGVVDMMKESVAEARKEIVLMAADERLVRTLIESLREARDKRGVNVDIAFGGKLAKSAEFRDWRNHAKALICNCNVIIADSRKLVTAELDDQENQYGIVTRNQSMIELMMRSFENPRCCV
ncbi:MAG: hypothetical protein KIY11_04060 [Thermoplasmata archaeon]|nr:hypothetical protein [Candidatus Sysuiplasma acidicola]